MNILSDRTNNLAPSGIREFFDLVLGMEDVISLGVGEPDFITPWNIRETAIHSIEKGFTSYTSNKGLKKLRELICQYHHKKHSIKYDPETEILITVGVSEAMDLAIRSLINPGDKVIIPEPCYVSYGATVTLSGGTPIFVNTKNSNFKLLPKQIEKACRKKPKCIILNYPCNPTGTSYTNSELQELKKVIEKNNLFVISDEIYDELTYDFKHTPWPSFQNTKSKCLYLNGFSKTFAMTGWRIGYALGPENIIQAMTKVHQYTMLCAPIISQMAAVEAITNGHKAVKEMKNEYNKRRQYFVKSLNKLGLTCPMPQGAFYAFCSVQSTGLSAVDFAKLLLKKERVAVVPGNAFGQQVDKYVRMSYATNLDHLREAISRIDNFIKKL